MRTLLSADQQAQNRLAAAGLLLGGGLCFLALLAYGLSKESFAGLLGPIIIACFALLVLARPANALTLYVLLAVATMPYQFLVLRGKSAAGGIFLSEVLLAIMLAGGFMRGAAKRSAQPRLLPSSLLWPLLGLALVPFVSVFSAYVTWDPEVPTVHRKLVVQFAGAGLIFLSATAALLPAAFLKRVAEAKVLLGVMAGLAIFSYLDVFGLASTPGRHLMYAVAPLAFAFALHTRRARGLLWLLFLLPPFLLAGQAVKVTLLVAILVPVLFISLAHSRRAFLLTLGALALSYVMLGAVLGKSPGLMVYEKATKMKDFDRVLLYRKAIGTWKEHPLFGVGPGGQFAYLGGEHFYGTAHSQYGNFLMETGLVGTVFLLWTLGAGISLGWKTYRHSRIHGQENDEHRFIRAFALGQTGGLLGMAIAGLLSDTLLPAVQNGGMYAFGSTVNYWLLLGVTAAFRGRQLQEEQTS